MKPVSVQIQAFVFCLFFCGKSLAFYDDKRKVYQSTFLFTTLLLI